MTLGAQVGAIRAASLAGRDAWALLAAPPIIVEDAIAATAPPSFVASQSRIAPPRIVRRAASAWLKFIATSVPSGKRERRRIAPPSGPVGPAVARPLISVTFFSVSTAL